MPKGRPRKPGERTPIGALKRVTDGGLTPTAIKRIGEDLARGAGDKRFESEVGRLLFLKKLNDREAAAAFKVGEIYGRYERLHARRRSAVSPSYTIGRSGAPELADERMTGDQIAIAAREKRERDVEAAFAALQDEIPAYPPRWRSILEALCVENQHIPEVWLPEVRWMLKRIAKAARIPGQKDEKGRGWGGNAGKAVPVGSVGRAGGTGPPPRGSDSPSIVPRQGADRWRASCGRTLMMRHCWRRIGFRWRCGTGRWSGRRGRSRREFPVIKSGVMAISH
jgi:hypothetical protein